MFDFGERRFGIRLLFLDPRHRRIRSVPDWETQTATGARSRKRAPVLILRQTRGTANGLYFARLA